jgi:RES domain-containing protein
VLNGLPVVREAFPRTVRLVSTANRRPSILQLLVEDEDLADLSEIEGATSARLIAQDRGIEGISARELIFGIPHAAFINAAFAYSKPRELNRFNGPGRGAWYAALDVETCLKEVVFHMTDFLGRTGKYEAAVEYMELSASMAGAFVDLRQRPDHPSLHPDPSVGYPKGNALADAVRAAGHNGIIYPSIRHSGGTCFAALWPHAVQSVAQGDMYSVVWSGGREPSVAKVIATT